MTINMGKTINADYKDFVGQRERILINQYGHTGFAIYAFFGVCERLKLPNPHITAAIKNGSGFKPKDSNNISNRYLIDPIFVFGTITENTDGKGYCSILIDEKDRIYLESLIKSHL